jgi:ribosomal protein L37E
VRTSSAANNLLGLTIRCEKCGGYAFLVKWILDPFKRERSENGSEIWTYECADCGYKTERSVKMKAAPVGGLSRRLLLLRACAGDVRIQHAVN